MKATVRNLIIGWALSSLFLACSNGQGEQQGTYEGTDIKEEFLAEHSGKYTFSDEWRDYGSTKSLNIKSDGTFEIEFENYRVDAGDKLGRTAVCSGVRKGNIHFVRKIDADVDHLTTGFTTHFFGKPRHLDAYLFLSGSEYEFSKTRTERYSYITRKTEVLTGENELTKDEYMKACAGWSRNYPETIHIERILPNALVLSDVWRSRNSPMTERFATKKKEEWIWLKGSAARDLLLEASERLSVSIERVGAFGVQPESLNEFHRNFKMTGRIEVDAAGSFKLGVGADVLNHFYPMMTLESRLVGVSYLPSTKELVMHIEKPYTVKVSTKEDGFNQLENSVQEMLDRESIKFYDIRQAITATAFETIQISMNMGGTKLLNIFAKDQK